MNRQTRRQSDCRLLVGLVGLALALGCGEAGETAPTPTAADGDRAVIEVAAETGTVFEWASGSVASARHTVVASRVLATIEEVRVRAGGAVEVGDVLVVLDARDLEARAQEAEQAHAAARARLVLAEREAERQAKLVAEGVGTVQESDRAAAALRVARADVSAAQRGLEAARIAKSHTEIHSPVAGRVVDRLAEPGDTATPGGPLLRIYDPSVLRVEAPVRESLAVKLQLGDLVDVEVESLGLRVEGAVDEIVPFAEAGARTLLVKVRLPADPRLYAGLFARVAIPAGERVRLLIPESAIVREGQLEQVVMAGAAGAARLRVVTTGERLADGRIEILSGLQAGERILAPEVRGRAEPGPAPSPPGAARAGAPDAAAVDRAAKAVARLKSTLVGELTAAIAQGGPENAIGVCRDRAPAIAQAVSEPGLRVGRASHKLRNPANVAPDWAAPLLAAWVAGESAGEPKALALEGGRTGYVEPLATAPMCLACHGEAIAPAVASRIAALYPEDRATGFRAGELRGIAWAEVEAGGAP
ncbi:MAG: efflux RND transporter periplasmic adaptor subunit [Myxococcota bacterium]